ncbi:MAG: polyphosphate kinase 2 family protein [Caldilineae bacterium]|nr:MAG: polyphosphate kinase 2 family protein [Caldilineae bacterium]
MERYRVQPGTKINLSEWDPNDKSAFEGGKKEGRKYLLDLNKVLEAQQELLYAEGKHKVLIVLQAMDTGGKDGTIRHVFEGVNPQGVRVASFKVPTREELAHDYLWRVHKHTPGSGEIVIFNRSHYEDVLVVRVHNLVPPEVWSRRYDHINAFERLLAEEGTTILKFFLHIDLEEQKQRLQARLDEPDKRWKFSPGDLDERKLWPQYMQAYEDVLSKTSTEYAPWYIVPANRKWYRNLVVATVIINTLKGLNMRYPEVDFNPADYTIE